MQSGKISYQDNVLHFTRYGHGPALLLAFHDRGQDQRFITALAQKLAQRYTIISFDLPGHGQTQWKDTMSKTALVTITERFKLEFNADRFAVLAFGLGARFALTLAEQRSEWIDTLWLYDPEGLYHQPWYGLESRSPLGQKIFRFFEQAPGRAIKILSSLASVKLVRKDRLQQMQQILNAPDYRKQVGQQWTMLKEIIPEPDKVRWLIKKHAIPVHLYIAALPPKSAQAFAKKLPTVQVYPGSKPEQLFEDLAQQA